jgi:integrase
MVGKAETRGKETFKRRALTWDQLIHLVEGSGKRGVVYALAGLTGLRRGEIKQLLWADVHLDTARPYIEVRAATTKNKLATLIPLVPLLADALRELRAHKVAFTDLVFHLGVPSAKSLAKDLVDCGIPVTDSRGWRVDFHALRNTFISLLRTAGVSEGGRVKLARHSEWRQTDHYTDPHAAGKSVANILAELRATGANDRPIPSRSQMLPNNPGPSRYRVR